ncbi:MAG: single-stranded DNA-binding protein [Candidatus Desulfovibrio kirbyi]|jgi:spoIIIJ-associated protein|uniref:RNA-binding protein KhpB n=1 Tax=Candidatus Desulfovibrio kirbyi TaxID=2696086 RepID=A0A6L2R7B9_9BACT|nr:MAG: single-stranded DNA-binding protein [Candidatus Desulfovibrio kirbyi]
MKNFMEFQAKNLDSAIEEACSYFNTVREKLEIEIVEDAKSGIFGIVGARKAKVRARRAILHETVQNMLDKKPGRNHKRPSDVDKIPDKLPADQPIADSKSKKHRKPLSNENSKKQTTPAYDIPIDIPLTDDGMDEETENLSKTPMENLDNERLEDLVAEAVRELTRPIVGEIQTTVTIDADRVRVAVSCAENSGLLIGREGQTLASLQYILSRIVSRGMDASVRVQLDAGDYRLRQDEKLRETALALAEKARQTGRSWSTRPLSSYHRRIIHLTLQDCVDIQTRSTGDGPIKRVVVMRTKTDR